MPIEGVRHVRDETWKHGNNNIVLSIFESDDMALQRKIDLGEICPSCGSTEIEDTCGISHVFHCLKCHINF